MREEDSRQTTREKAMTLIPLILAALLFSPTYRLVCHGLEISGAVEDPTPSSEQISHSIWHVTRNIDDVEQMLSAQEERGNRPAVLWLGNSQTLHIDDPPTDPAVACIAPGILRARLDQKGIDVLAITPIGGNHLEHYLLYEYVRHRMRPLAIVIGVSYDCLRILTTSKAVHLLSVLSVERIRKKHLIITNNLTLNTSGGSIA